MCFKSLQLMSLILTFLHLCAVEADTDWLLGPCYVTLLVSDNFFASISRCSRCFLDLSCPRSGISHFSKDPRFMFSEQWYLKTTFWSPLLSIVLTEFWQLKVLLLKHFFKCHLPLEEKVNEGQYEIYKKFLKINLQYKQLNRNIGKISE